MQCLVHFPEDTEYVAFQLHAHRQVKEGLHVDTHSPLLVPSPRSVPMTPVGLKKRLNSQSSMDEVIRNTASPPPLRVLASPLTPLNRKRRAHNQFSTSMPDPNDYGEDNVLCLFSSPLECFVQKEAGQVVFHVRLPDHVCPSFKGPVSYFYLCSVGVKVASSAFLELMHLPVQVIGSCTKDTPVRDFKLGCYLKKDFHNLFALKERSINAIDLHKRGDPQLLKVSICG